MVQQQARDGVAEGGHAGVLGAGRGLAVARVAPGPPPRLPVDWASLDRSNPLIRKFFGEAQ